MTDKTVPKDVVDRAKEVGISEEQLESAVKLLKPHYNKLSKWAKVAIGIGIAVALFLLRHYDWL